MKCYVVLILIVVAGGFSCSINNDVSILLHRAEALMSEHPELALDILKSIDNSELSTNSVKARYAMLYTQALDKNYVDVMSDSLICFAVEYYNRKGTSREKALANYYYGCVHANLCEDSVAIKSFVMADWYAAQTSDSYLRGLINSRIGTLYCQNHNYDEAQLRFQESEKYFRVSGSLKNTAMALENQSYVDYLLSNNESARDKKYAAREIYMKLGETDAVHNIDMQLIPIRIDSGENLDSIKMSLRRMCVDYYGERFPLSMAGVWLDLFKISGQLDSAKMCGKAILANRKSWTEHQIAGCYAQLVEVERLAGNFEKALEYGYAYTRLSDSLNVASNLANIEGIENRYGNRLLKESLTQLQLKHRLQHTTFVFVLGCILIVAAVTVATIIRWRKRTKEKMRNAMAELDNLRITYDDLILRYGEMKQHMDLCNDRELKIGKAIEERLFGLRQLVDKASTMKPSVFIKEFKNYMAVNTNSKYALFDLQYIVNQKYSGIIDHLQTQYPELNKHDLDLCALMCFGFSQTGICYLYDYSDIGSFYNKRSRLRRKLHLPQDYKIEEFIQIMIAKLREL